MKQKIDKIIAIGGFTLLAYYLGISLFRMPILTLLRTVLPPINERNHPVFYIGLFGIAIAAPLSYLIYTFSLQKLSLVKHKKQYIISAVSLLILPLLVVMAFRIHTVSIVKYAENTTPTEIHIWLQNEIRFETSEHSSTDLKKSAGLLNNDPALKEIKDAVLQLSLQSVITNNDSSEDIILFMTYKPKDRYYSKILSYKEDLFRERINSKVLAAYEGTALKSILQKLIKDAEDINQYTEGSIIHSSWINEKSAPKKTLTPTEYETLVSYIRDDNKTSPAAPIQEYFDTILEKQVEKDNQDIYGIYLSNEPTSTKKIENFMLYSAKHNLLRFEDQYYNADLLSVIGEK